MTATRKLLFFTVPAFLLMMAVLEMIFRLIPACEVPYVFFDPVDRILRYDVRFLRTGTYTIGKWAQQGGRWRINNYGWNSEIDYSAQKRDRKLVVIIGDSYVQSFEVELHEAFPALLRSKLGSNYQVYSFGISGASLSQYLQMTRYVKKHFKPDLIVYNVVHNDFLESVWPRGSSHFLRIRPEGRTFVEVAPTPYRPNKWKRLFKSSGIARYFYENLRFYQMASPGKPVRYEGNVDTTGISSNKQIAIEATHFLVHQIRKETSPVPVIFQIDGLRNKIYAGQSPLSASTDWMNRALQDACKNNQGFFLDLGPTFLYDYQKHHKKFNSEYDGHWNSYGHFVVAERLYSELRRLKLLG